MKNLLIAVFALSSLAFTSVSFAEDTAMAERIKLQLKSPGRDQFDAIKDPGRKPLEVVQFFA